MTGGGCRNGGGPYPLCAGEGELPDPSGIDSARSREFARAFRRALAQPPTGWHEGRIGLSTARLLRGAPVARRIRQDVQVAADNLRMEFGVQPAVATMLVGNAGPSAAYHEAISKAMGGCGIDHIDVTLPVSASTGRVVDELQR